jgi:hypothetical protein
MTQALEQQIRHSGRDLAIPFEHECEWGMEKERRKCCKR